MAEHTHFIRELTFERLATEDATMTVFQEFVQAMQSARWNLYKMEKTTNDAGESGMMFYMKDIDA